ncbi:MAG TPA: PQQ-dependent sugar dehydrogenase [Vicinamibacteria bacterium]
MEPYPPLQEVSMRLSPRMLTMCAVLVAAVSSCWPVSAQDLPADFTDSLVASVGGPTALAFTPDGRLLITTQGGTLRVYQSGTLLGTPALTIPAASICTQSERGLLGVAVDPSFASNQFIYLYYTANIGGIGCKNRVSRFTLPSGNVINPASELVLIDRIHSTAGNHNGGDVHFGMDGYLYVSAGDGGCDYNNDSGCAGANDASRDRNVLIGKILRITADGNIPATNPFQGAGTARCNVTGITTPGTLCEETFAWGFRNPFRIAFDPASPTTRFFVNDVGQDAWEEIDLAQSGADFGWNCREGAHTNNTSGPCNPTPPNMVDPVFEYSHSDPNPIFSGCGAITGGAFVPAGVWPASFDGSYLFSDFNCGRIFQRTPGGAVSQFDTGLGGSSAVTLIFGPFNTTQSLYYTTYASGGQVRRITYTGTLNRAPVAMLATNPTGGPPPLTVNFDGSGSSDPDPGDTLTYNWDFGDGSAPTSTSSPTTSHAYVTTGAFMATLRVQDNHGALSDPASVLILVNNSADFNADALSDILWRRLGTGDNVVWFMNGTTLAGGAVLTGVPDTNWRIVGTSDFDNDGKVDILWRNQATGANLIWFMNTTTIASGVFLTPVSDLNWRIVATGDFNADGRRDILWRNQATGDNVVWFMNGATLVGGAVLTAVPDANWNVGGVGDFNADGRPDILWRNYATGANAVWFMNGTTISGGAVLPAVPDTNWRMVGVSDFSGDGRADILWRNRVTGDNVVWFMNGTTVTGGAVLPAVPDVNWEIVGPR